MDEQLVLVIGAGLLAALPGIIALLVGRRRTAAADTTARDRLLQQLQEQVMAQQKTIRFLTERVNELEAAREREYAETEVLREEAEVLRQEVRELRRGVQTLIGQMETERLTPAWRPAEKPAAPRGRAADATAQLRDALVAGWSREEIDDLAFGLGISADELSGETKKTRARALVEYLKSRGRLSELETAMGRERPERE